MERRDFIRLSVVSTASFASVLAGCSTGNINPLIAQPPLLSHLVDAKTLRDIGQTYLKKAPAENDENKLADLLLKDNPAAASRDAKAVHSAFDKKIQRDFETGQMTIVNGWVLSLTEARQCALFVLLK